MSRGSGRHWWIVAALCALLCAPGAAQARPAAPGYTLIFADVSVAISGHLGVQAHNDCGGCAQGAFLNGSFNAGFSSEVHWKNVPLLLKGSLPGIPSPDGYPAQDAITGTWSATGQDFGGDGSPPTSFTCNGAVRDDPGNPSAAAQTLIDQRIGNRHLLQMTVAGDPAALGSHCDMATIGALMANYYNNDNTNATGPFSGSVNLTQADFDQDVIYKSISPQRADLPPADCTWMGSSWFGADHCSDTFSWSGNVVIKPNCERIDTGPGYDGLSAKMKAGLTKLYANLKAKSGCWHFTIGYRSTTVQQDLYNRWHKIADGSKGNTAVCKQLHSAGFKQCPKGYNPNGTAQGGPAKPGTSRHERGEAADITVVFKPSLEENLGKFRAAASDAGLCPPPPSDAVHVELPRGHKKNGNPICNFKK